MEENKIELYHTVDALRRAQAERITLFETYCSPGRSDRTTRRNSVGLWVHLKTLIGLGINHVITFNLHSDKSRTMIDPNVCAFDDIPILFLLKKHIADEYIKSIKNLKDTIQKNWVFCSVDAGGEMLAKKFASSFNVPLVIAHKQRDYSCVNKVLPVKILSNIPLEGKHIWIIDDMIDTGGSIYKLVLKLIEQKVASVNIAIVHPVLSGPAMKRLLELSEKGYLKKLVFSDSIYCSPEILNQLKNITLVSSHNLAADIIYRLNQELSLSHFFEPFKGLEYLSKKTEE